MDRRDPFPRRTATLRRLAPWLAELARSANGLVESYGPGAALDPRLRERVTLAVTEVNGCRYCAWVHGSWRDLLGPGEGAADVEDSVLAWARAAADAGHPLDAGELGERVGPRQRSALRATVAQAAVSNLVGNTVDGLVARLTRKRPLQPLAAAEEAAVVAAALPVAVPLVAAAAVMRAVARAAPPMPTVEMPPEGEANLLVHLLAQAIPAYLSNAVVRAAVLGLPVSLAFGLKPGRPGATVTLGRGRVAITNGVARDALIVVEGEVEPLLRLATGHILGEVRRLRVRPA
jgi:AhpD family alkylhydroperoxidase